MSQRSANYKRQGQKGMKCLGLTPWNVARIKENHLSVKCPKRYRTWSVPNSNYVMKFIVYCIFVPRILVFNQNFNTYGYSVWLGYSITSQSHYIWICHPFCNLLSDQIHACKEVMIDSRPNDMSLGSLILYLCGE